MILIADDSKFMRHYLKNLLQKQGFTRFVDAKNGEQAILLYRLLKPKITFLDITMPIIDGLSALKEIKELDPAATVIMCSSLSTLDNRTTARAYGATGFIAKPNFHALPAILEKIYEQQGVIQVEVF